MIKNNFPAPSIHWLRSLGAIQGKDEISEKVFYQIRIPGVLTINVKRHEDGDYFVRIEGPNEMSCQAVGRNLKSAFFQAVEDFSQKIRPIVEMTERLEELLEKKES